MALRKNWRSLEEASAWAQAHNVRSVSEWRTLSKTPDFPDDLPPSPDNAYKKLGWPGWGAFLGTGTVAPQNKTFRPYAEASAWAQAQGIKTQKEWIAACKEPDFPNDIPKNLARGYGEEFLGLGDFLGTGAIAPQNRIYREIDDASLWAIEHNITTKEEWLERAKATDFPADLPADPRKVYGEQFQGWPAFLRSGRLSNHDRSFRTVDEASRWAQDQSITTMMAWRERARQPNFPTDIPKNPTITYGTAWPGWGVFLGTGRVAHQDRAFRPYNEAAQWAQDQGITSALQWFEQAKQSEFPTDLPVNPAVVYGDDFKQHDGWRGFLGQTRLSGSSKIEKALKQGLAAVLNLSPESRSTVPLTAGLRPISVDMVDRERRLIIEYDGWFWHHNTRKEAVDRRKTLMLTQVDPAWRVIRVREAPLSLLDPVWDVAVPLPNGQFGPTIIRVMQHLKNLVEQQHLPDNGLLKRLDAALKQTIDDRQFKDLFQAGWASREEASAWARAKGITSHRQWRERCQAPDFPDNLPKYPDEAYGATFGSWGEFLGTGVVASREKPFRSYEEAQQWAIAEGISSQNDWRFRVRQGGATTQDLPANPERTYKDEFQNWGHFLNTGRIAHQNRSFRSYDKASLWAQSEGIVTETQWRERRKNPDFPNDLPAAPDRTYKENFKSWGEFLGTGNLAPTQRTFRSYENTAAWARAQNIRSEPQWRIARKASDFPHDIPKNPQSVYGKLFISWGDFLGTGTVATSQRTFRTYTETSQWARRENIRSARQWQERCQQPDFPTDVPTHPERVYRDFPGWGTFLGTANIANIKRTFRPCEEAARWAQAEGIANQEAWRERVKQPEFPLDIPRAPDHTYGQKFPGWGAFLNTPTFQARSTVVPSRNSLAERLDQPTVNESLDRPSPFPWRRSPRTC